MNIIELIALALKLVILTHKLQLLNNIILKMLSLYPKTKPYLINFYVAFLTTKIIRSKWCAFNNYTGLW